MASSIYQHLLNARDERGAAFIVLIDPDKLAVEALPVFATMCHEAGVDALFVGGSLLHATAFEEYLERLREVTSLPLIGFPGSLSQLSARLDALLYLSVISGRNPEYLFGQHVHAAPLIRRLGVEPISTGYMLVESGRATTAQYMSHTQPLPRHKPDVAAATALAAEMMGMRLLYADGGSGADQTVPEEMIAAICETCTLPLVVGGGLREPDEIARKVRAGASVIVVGTAIEQRPDAGYLTELVQAAHVAVPRSL
ncbi:MAG: geranylgeranylglyceryl/heptaprenylglyceryl phosphate synthase [Rhodothermales bacterium]